MSEFLPDTSDPASGIVAGDSQSFQANLQAAQRLFQQAAKTPTQVIDPIMPYVLDWLQVSNFAIPITQIIGSQGSQIVGVIPATGSTATAGEGFSYTHSNGTGIYVFTFTSAFSSIPATTVTLASDTSNVPVYVSTQSASGFTVKINGNLDAAFNFVSVASS